MYLIIILLIIYIITLFIKKEQYTNYYKLTTESKFNKLGIYNQEVIKKKLDYKKEGNDNI